MYVEKKQGIATICFPSSSIIGFNVASTDQNTEDKVDIETHIKGNKLTIPGTQIIGYCCHRLGICPNPHSEITEWV